MNKLIKAEFVRLFKSNIFKLCILFPIGLGMLSVLMRWSDVKMNPDIYAQLSVEYKNADGLLFVGGLYIVFAIAVFISIFTGTEYSDGTIRNKLIVGHTRYDIYFSKLIVCAVNAVTINLLYILTVLILGNIFIDGTTVPVEKIILLTAINISIVLAITACLLMLSMSIQSKAVGAVVCLLTTIIMLFTSITIFQRLSEPEYYDAYTYTDEETGETIEIEDREKNPRYLTEEQRKIYEFLNNFIPTSQIYQIMQLSTDNKKIIVIYDLILIVASTGAGVVIFKKKNLK